MDRHDSAATTPSLMTRVYQYGLLPPTAEAHRIDEQIWLAHRYQQTLTAIERDRRVRRDTVLAAHPAIAALERRLADLLTSRAITPDDPVVREALDAVTRDLRMTRTQVRTTDAPTVTALAAIDAAAKAAAKAARGTCGVFWGSYLLVERSMDQVRRSRNEPRMPRWTGDGSIGVQLQQARGQSVSDITDGTHGSLRLDLRPQPLPGRGGQPRPRVRLRLGSAGRAPIWGEWPVILHRPLPAAARITWAQVSRRRIGSQTRWTLQLTVAAPAPVAPVTDRAVALDVRWRGIGSTALHVGTWSDGETRGTLTLDARQRGTRQKVADLRSIRDDHLNALRTALVTWRAAQDTLAQDLADALAYLPQWRSPRRFVRLAHWWRDHRQSGDDGMYPLLEAWRVQDRHLWDWESHARRRADLRRREGYRVAAADLAERYDVLVVERIALDRLAQVPAQDDPGQQLARTQRIEAAPSLLRQACVQAFTGRGKRVVTVRAAASPEALLTAYRERQDVEESPGGARTSRISEIRAQARAKRAAATAAGEALA